MLDRLMHPEYILYSLPAILIALVMHELAHAFVADRLGDPTPRSMGRMTLNPIPHIDPIGFVMLILVGFGWAKPVMTNPAMYKKCRKHGFALVGIAGPLMNLLLTIVFLFIFDLMVVKQIITSENYLFYIMTNAFYINAMLFVFNLIPVPPLDGYNILKDLVLIKHINTRSLWNFERYGQYILLGLLVVVSYVIPSVLSNAIFFIVDKLNFLILLIFPFLR